MKILITYFSQTGNTEKVAKSIGEGISGENPIIKAINDVDVNSLTDYDLIFLGTPVHGNSLSKVAKKFLKACPENAPYKFALFSTHGTPGTQEKTAASGLFKSATKILTKSNISAVETFSCLGEIKNEQVIEMLKAAMPDQVDEILQGGKDHPNDTDLANAKEFSKNVIDINYHILW